jgi:hypothetical protein
MHQDDGISDRVDSPMSLEALGMDILIEEERI